MAMVVATKLKTMDMWAIVPVKYLKGSKSRLAPVLDRTQRIRFTLTMVHDVLEQLVQVKALDGVGVLSNDERVQKLAEQLNVRVWSDQADDLNSGLQTVKAELAVEGYGVMVVPCDVPVARAQDYRQLLAGHDGGVTLVEASADGGTNTILCDAGLDFLFQYGSGSFEAHVLEAKRNDIPLTIADIPRLHRDIDRPDDLRWLQASGYDCRAVKLLRQLLRESAL